VTALELLLIGLACFGVGAGVGFLVSVAPPARYVAAAADAVGCALLFAAGVASLVSPGVSIALPASTPLSGFDLRANALSGVFLLLTGLVGLAITIYSSAYIDHVGGRRRQAAMFVLLSLTFASLAVLLAAGNAFTFLLAWEAMSVLTYALVALEYEHPEAPQAAFLMLAQALPAAPPPGGAARLTRSQPRPLRRSLLPPPGPAPPLLTSSDQQRKARQHDHREGRQG
jgi:hydrogenase-4 component B